GFYKDGVITICVSYSNIRAKLIFTTIHEFAHAITDEREIIQAKWNEIYYLGAPTSIYACQEKYYLIRGIKYNGRPFEDFADLFGGLVSMNSVYSHPNNWWDAFNIQQDLEDVYLHGEHISYNCPLAGCTNYAGLQKLTWMYAFNLFDKPHYENFVNKLEWDKCLEPAISTDKSKMETDTCIGSHRCSMLGKFEFDITPRGELSDDHCSYGEKSGSDPTSPGFRISTYDPQCQKGTEEEKKVCCTRALEICQNAQPTHGSLIVSKDLEGNDFTADLACYYWKDTPNLAERETHYGSSVQAMPWCGGEKGDVIVKVKLDKFEVVNPDFDT
ncbi:MAG: hypothetical protein HY606_06960, partial [Planctomycetes bacterium]|nr:hypothetical protein [Planctomycetota bacterium]